MRLLLSAFSLTVCIALTSCTNGQNSFPNNISVTKTENLKRLKGTKLFVSTPDNYKPMESMIRLQRDNNTYFQAIEIPNSNFNEYKGKLTKQAIESQATFLGGDTPDTNSQFDFIFLPVELIPQLSNLVIR